LPYIQSVHFAYNKAPTNTAIGPKYAAMADAVMNLRWNQLSGVALRSLTPIDPSLAPARSIVVPPPFTK